MSGSIKLKTKLPGPKSSNLLKLKHKNISDGVSTIIPVFAKSGHGALVDDVDGNTFIDFIGGIGAMNCGHGNKYIIDRMNNQAENLVHTCFPVVQYSGYLDLCKKLNSIVKIGNTKTALFNCGAEAVENAVKFAKKFTGRKAVVSFEHGFHGRTLYTLSLTSKVKPYKFGFGPFVPETYKLPYPYVYRKPSTCFHDKEYVDHLLSEIENEFFIGVVAPENIAAIIIELVTGEGGFIVAPKRYVQGLSKLCKKYGIMLIIDEVQSGFARTGKMFSFEHYGIKPDIVTMAKSMSNGMPISAVTGRKEVMDSVQVGGIGGTFCGNPVCCESALATIDFIEKNKLVKKANKIGKIVMDRFNNFKDNFDCVGDVRGLGAMSAMEIVEGKDGKIPDKARVGKMLKYCYQHGLLLLNSGILGNDIRTLMPLVISNNELNEGLDVIEKALYKNK